MVRHPGIQINPLEANPSGTDRDLGQVWPHLRVKNITAHAKIGRCVVVSNDAGREVQAFLRFSSLLAIMSAQFARTNAAASGGQTLLPHMRT